LKSDQDVKTAFDSGAKQITGGSIAAKEPALFERWLAKYGSDAVVLGADARDSKIAVVGWLEMTEFNVFDFVDQYAKKGVSYVISTDIESDGAMQGPAFGLYQQMLQQNPKLKVIASGGVTTIEDVEKLDAQGCFGAIIGKALYEGTIDLAELSKRYANAEKPC
jgi:phosphoribosylformimino-5-aminoimidazole carboxamide ribotide isomerase